jgi:transcriptional regulator with XRE-family HTH domain
MMMMQLIDVLRQRVRECRERKGWSQNELAKRAMVPQATLWRLESGYSKRIDVIQVRNLARALGVGIDHLVGTHEADVELVAAAIPGLATSHRMAAPSFYLV